MNILIIEDEKEIAELVELYLKSANFNTFKAHTGRDGLNLVRDEKIDLAIIDLMLPDMDGFQICSDIRENHNFPIIMLTAKNRDIDKIEGLSIGADDYMTKPFKPLELVARVKAQLRRFKTYNGPSEVESDGKYLIKGLILDTNEHTVYLDEEELNLTPIEFQILELLVKNKNSVVKSDDLFRQVWKEKYYSNANNTIMVHVRHIREKMKDSTEKPKYIKTVWGVGYKIEE